MGRFSRQKGYRVERALVDYLNEEGWDAKRMPLSGMAKGFKGDVLAVKGNKSIRFEVKARASEFKAIYALLDNSGGSLGIYEDGLVVYASYFLNHAQTSNLWVPTIEVATKSEKRTRRKLRNMYKLLGESDILVLKGDRKPWVFVRYSKVDPNTPITELFSFAGG